MKKTLFLLPFVSCAFALSACEGGGGGETSLGPQPGDYAYQAPLEEVDLSALQGELIMHYSLEDEGVDREDSYGKWRAWMWAEGKEGKEYNPNGIDDFGSIFHYSLEELTGVSSPDSGKIGFIVKSLGDGSPWAGSVVKDGEADRFIDLSSFQKDERGNVEIWLQSGISAIYDAPPTSRDALGSCYFFESGEEIRFFLTASAGKIVEATLLENGKPLENFVCPKPSSGTTFAFPGQPSLTSAYSVKAKFESGTELESAISFYPLFRSKSFSSSYDYSGPLGVEASAVSATFRVWSPMSESIKVRVYDAGASLALDPEQGSDALFAEAKMEKGEKGVFQATIQGDLRGKYYTFVVDSAYFKQKEIVDPYARGAGLGGKRGMIVDFAKTNPEGWDEVSPRPYDRKELVVYETHVQDVTSSKTWNGEEKNRGKFLGLAEKGTAYVSGKESVPTGYDYLSGLGFNALQLMPIFDAENDELNPHYNWGYNPLNYNVLEGAYSSNPRDGYARIKEFKEVVKAYADSGINIIMDVVYNHVNAAAGSNFDVLMPGYYFRYLNAGAALSNGSGCGNETASELPMMRRFIVDSTSFLAKEYKLGGFRFDLMALEDIETMDLVTATLKENNPAIVVYGEPWAGGSSPLDGAKAASQANAYKFQGYGQFNDGMRDALIKGGMKGYEELGFVTEKDLARSNSGAKDREAIVSGLAGFTLSSGSVEDADKTTNYVTCHDNFTLNDRFDAAAKTNASKGLSYTVEEKKKMNLLANAFVLLSQGTSFLNAGEEFLRTKGGSHNSYGGDPLSEEMIEAGFTSWSKVNELDYALALERGEMVEAYREMIRWKTSNPDFQQATSLKENPVSVLKSEEGLIVVDVKGAKKDYRLAFRNGLVNDTKVDFSTFALEWALGEGPILGPSTALAPYQAVVASKIRG